MDYALKVLEVFSSSWPLALMFIVFIGALGINWNIRRITRSDERRAKAENQHKLDVARMNQKVIEHDKRNRD